MRSAIAQIPGTQDFEVSVEERLVHLKYRADKTSLQELIQAIEGKHARFQARLVLKIEGPKVNGATFDKAQLAVEEVKGVMAMSLPDKDGLVLLTFEDKPKTFLPALLKASKTAGVTLVDLGTKPAKLRL